MEFDGHDTSAASRTRVFRTGHKAAVRTADQSLLSKRPECELRQTCAYSDPGPDQLRGDHSATLGGPILGRKPARRTASLSAHARTGRNYGPPDFRDTGV